MGNNIREGKVEFSNPHPAPKKLGKGKIGGKKMGTMNRESPRIMKIGKEKKEHKGEAAHKLQTDGKGAHTLNTAVRRKKGGRRRSASKELRTQKTRRGGREILTERK